MKTLSLIILTASLGAGCGSIKNENTEAEKPEVVAPGIAIQNKTVEIAIEWELKKPIGRLTQADLEKLTTLGLGYSKITDAGLKEVAQLQQLTSLDLAGTKITDAGLKELAQLQQLTTLSLSYTKITDAGLKELAKLQQPTTLYLSATKFTDAGVAELRKALPKCEIDH